MQFLLPLTEKGASVNAMGQKLLALIHWLDCFAQRHQEALFWVLAVVYRISLDLLYCCAAYPTGGNMLRPFYSSAFRYCISLFLYLLLFFFMPRREKDGVVLAVQLQFVYSVAPVLTFYAFSNTSGKYVFMVAFCILLETILIFRPMNVSKPVRIKGVQSYMTVMLGIVVIFTIVIPILYNGFAGLKAFNLAYVYVIRGNASYPPGFGYLLSWIPKAILPFGFLCFLHMKKYRWAMLVGILQVFFFMLTGQKLTLYILVPMVAVYLCAKSGHCLKLMYLGLSGLFLLIAVFRQLDQPASIAGQPLSSLLGVLLASQISVRALFIPASIKTYFYEYFSTHPKLLFSDGLIGRILGLTYPYKRSVGHVIHAFEKRGSDFVAAEANTGYLGEAYAQMGFVGMILISVLLALLLRSLRVYNQKGFAPLLATLLAIHMIFLNDIPFFTNLFTGGMIVTYILIFIYFDAVTKGAEHGIHRL